MNNSLAKLFRIANNQNPSTGFTLIELLIAASLTTVVTGLAGSGMVVMTENNKKAQAETERRVELNRALDFISDEARQAEFVAKDASATLGIVAPSFDRTDKTPVLTLKIPGIAERVIYYTAAKPANSPWLGPNIIYRWGPNLNEDGKYTNATTPGSWIDDVALANPVVDLVVDTALTEDPCPSIGDGWTLTTSVANAQGFYACVDPNGRIAEPHMLGKLRDAYGNSRTKSFDVTTKAFARSFELAAAEGADALADAEAAVAAAAAADDAADDLADAPVVPDLATPAQAAADAAAAALAAAALTATNLAADALTASNLAGDAAHRTAVDYITAAEAATAQAAAERAAATQATAAQTAAAEAVTQHTAAATAATALATQHTAAATAATAALAAADRAAQASTEYAATEYAGIERTAAALLAAEHTAAAEAAEQIATAAQAAANLATAAKDAATLAYNQHTNAAEAADQRAAAEQTAATQVTAANTAAESADNAQTTASLAIATAANTAQTATNLATAAQTAAQTAATNKTAAAYTAAALAATESAAAERTAATAATAAQAAATQAATQHTAAALAATELAVAERAAGHTDAALATEQRAAAEQTAATAATAAQAAAAQAATQHTTAAGTAVGKADNYNMASTKYAAAEQAATEYATAKTNAATLAQTANTAAQQAADTRTSTAYNAAVQASNNSAAAERAAATQATAAQAALNGAVNYASGADAVLTYAAAPHITAANAADQKVVQYTTAATNAAADEANAKIFTTNNGTVSFTQNSAVSIQVLGGDITCNAGGAVIPTTITPIINGITSTTLTSTTRSLDVPAGSTLTLTGAAPKNTAICSFFNGSSYNSATNSAATNVQQVLALRDGDTPPIFSPFGNQRATIESFLTNYINPATGKVTIKANQVIYLYELGAAYNATTRSEAYDMQDLVVLATIGATTKTVPIKPTITATSNLSSKVVTLSWSAVTHADTYELYKCTIAKTGTCTPTTLVNSNVISGVTQNVSSGSGVTNTQKVSFAVKAKNGLGTSALSNILSFNNQGGTQ